MLTISETQDSCNFALMSYAGGEGDYSGLGGTSWGKVNAGGTSMMTQCLRRPKDPSGGVVVIPSGKSGCIQAAEFGIRLSERHFQLRHRRNPRSVSSCGNRDRSLMGS